MSLLFNMLSMLVIAFLPQSKRLLISRLQSPSAVILELPKIVSAVKNADGFSYKAFLINGKLMFLLIKYQPRK